MIKASLIALLLSGLSGCGLVTTQAVYEEIRDQEKARAVGQKATPGTALPQFDIYEKERAKLSP